eukprot:CAMPEP_0173245660 /NCGR_PEP_ID=MMETSP1142-20121109/16874_1 /TAXON_ID=483371 /ORGANISM="non described non described, Strain CCMP2298" /LENGTH=57 /DNA_ID=CAMNT_0014177775 /DNA_START=94 /DNA_END=267 /DNA_ORIENTATION=-
MNANSPSSSSETLPFSFEDVPALSAAAFQYTSKKVSAVPLGAPFCSSCLAKVATQER